MGLFDKKPPVVDSGKWTGMDNPGCSVDTIDASQVSRRLDGSPKKISPRVDHSVMREDAIAEYRQVAKEVGISDQDMMVEEFRLFLSKHDIPSFNLQEVVSYMDEIAAKDNPHGYGWHWCPVRPRDAEVAMTFGRPSQRDYNRGDIKLPASDFYESHQFQKLSSHSERGAPSPRDWRKEYSPAYTRTLPLHALKKIALVEKHFTAGKAVFLVTDYTTAPHIIVNPDPFLMAVIPNSAVAHGKGRFIIDVWDEPGFGIERMLK